MNGESRASQRISSTQERPIPAIVALVAEQRVEVARLVDRRAASSSSGGAGQASGPRVATISSAGDLSGGQQLRPGALLGPELAQPQLAAVAEADKDPRAPVPQRGPLVEDLQPSRRHHVDEQRQLRPVAVAELDDRHLADPPDPVDRSSDDRVERRLDALQRDHARRERGFDLRALQGPSMRRTAISTSGSSGTGPA